MESDDFSAISEENFREKPDVGIGGPVSLVGIKTLFKTENLSSIFVKAIFDTRFSLLRPFFCKCN